jgi:hypothetical protein
MKMSKLAELILDTLGTCPYDQFDVEPHDFPCSECCTLFEDKVWECWDAWNEREKSDGHS